jgi:hypothetical protein
VGSAILGSISPCDDASVEEALVRRIDLPRSAVVWLASWDHPGIQLTVTHSGAGGVLESGLLKSLQGVPEW